MSDPNEMVVGLSNIQTESPSRGRAIDMTEDVVAELATHGIAVEFDGSRIRAGGAEYRVTMAKDTSRLQIEKHGPGSVSFEWVSTVEEAAEWIWRDAR